MQSQLAVQLALRFSFWDGLGGKKHQGSVEIAVENMHAIESMQFTRRKAAVLYFQGKKMLQE